MKSKREAYFLLSSKNLEQRFVVKLLDEKKIEEARGLITAGSNTEHLMKGKVVRKKVRYNPLWNYFIDPGSISFTQDTQEGADAEPDYVEGNLAKVGRDILPKRVWAPSSLKLEKEIGRKEAMALDKVAFQVKITGAGIYDREATIYKDDVYGGRTDVQQVVFNSDTSRPIYLEEDDYILDFSVKADKVVDIQVKLSASPSQRLTKVGENPQIYKMDRIGTVPGTKTFTIV